MRHGNARRFFRALWDRLCEGRLCAALFALLLSAVVTATVFEGIMHRRNGVVTGVLTLLLLFSPVLFELLCSIRLGSCFKMLAYLFVFSAGVLGEMAGFYSRISFFDDVLHVISGFLFAALGVGVAALCAGAEQERKQPAPLVAAFSLCFSLSVGVLWELFEHAADRILHTDMQKDTVVRALHSVFLSDRDTRSVVHIKDITRVIVLEANGRERVLDGYLDVGLFDTMNDLVMNLLGAGIFCVLFYRYLCTCKGRAVARFIPTVQRKTLEKGSEACYNERGRK